MCGAFGGTGFIGAQNPAAALNNDAVFCASNLRRQCDLELDVRADLKTGIGLDVNAGGAQMRVMPACSPASASLYGLIGSSRGNRLPVRASDTNPPHPWPSLAAKAST